MDAFPTLPDDLAAVLSLGGAAFAGIEPPALPAIGGGDTITITVETTGPIVIGGDVPAGAAGVYASGFAAGYGRASADDIAAGLGTAYRHRRLANPKSRRPRALLADPARSRVFRIPAKGGGSRIVQHTGWRARAGKRRGAATLPGLRDPNLHVLYTAAPLAHLPPLLGFEETRERTVRERFAANVERAYARALETMR